MPETVGRIVAWFTKLAGVQLQREGAPAGQCWEANYSISGIATNGSGIVRGRSD